ncbi:MAG: hypothetical protein GY730_07570 [bacterium]|nr:hypothetical protein [bacterium]
MGISIGASGLSMSNQNSMLRLQQLQDAAAKLQAITESFDPAQFDEKTSRYIFNILRDMNEMIKTGISSNDILPTGISMLKNLRSLEKSLQANDPEMLQHAFKDLNIPGNNKIQPAIDKKINAAIKKILPHLDLDQQQKLKIFTSSMKSTGTEATNKEYWEGIISSLLTNGIYDIDELTIIISIIGSLGFSINTGLLSALENYLDELVKNVVSDNSDLSSKLALLNTISNVAGSVMGTQRIDSEIENIDILKQMKIFEKTGIDQEIDHIHDNLESYDNKENNEDMNKSNNNDQEYNVLKKDIDITRLSHYAHTAKITKEMEYKDNNTVKLVSNDKNTNKVHASAKSENEDSKDNQNSSSSENNRLIKKSTDNTLQDDKDLSHKQRYQARKRIQNSLTKIIEADKGKLVSAFASILMPVFKNKMEKISDKLDYMIDKISDISSSGTVK